jgi:hypothetical protein
MTTEREANKRKVKEPIERIVIANPDADDDRVRELYVAEVTSKARRPLPMMRQIVDEVFDSLIDEVRADLATKRN